MNEAGEANTNVAQSTRPGKTGKGRWVRWLALAGVCLGLMLGAVKVFSMRSHDRDNPRSLPNSYLMTHEVIVDAPPERVFHFITHRLKDHYQQTAKAHERFEIIGADHLTEGAVYVSEEFTGTEGVHNRYVIRSLVPNQLVYMASTPSTIYERKDGELTEVGTCNAHVYFDLHPEGARTRLAQTLVVQMPNFLVKFLIDVIATQSEDNEWQRHLVEELEGLKQLVEQDAAGAVTPPVPGRQVEEASTVRTTP